MKYLIALFLFTPLFLASRDAQAMVPKIDSVYADSILTVIGTGIVNSVSILHKPDLQYCQLAGNGPTIDLEFKKYKSTAYQQIHKDANIFVWGKKDASVDSSAGFITFWFDDFSGTTYNTFGTPILLHDGLNIIPVPGGVPYTYIELSLAVDAHGKGATSYFIDAVALVEDTAAPTKSVPSQPLLTSSISSYPNPFISNTTIHFELESTGDVQLAVIDALGRETGRVDAGYLENGVHEIPLAIRTPGFYFVRLLVNGQPVGNPLKITSR